jgi:two-component system LytT family sensor kinase
VFQEPRFLSADQFLLTTLIVKLAVVAVLATMLARYRRFRPHPHLRTARVDRSLVFTLALAVPLMAGVAFRMLLNYNAADLTLEGAFLAGLIAGPYTGALVGFLVGVPALMAGEFAAIPFAVGCGFAGGGLREACPKEVIWQFSPFVFVDLPKHVWKMVRRLETNWPLVLLLAAVGARARAPGARRPLRRHRLFYLGSPSIGMKVLVVLATVLAVATPIKIWNSARIEHRLQEQETLLMAAKIEALKSQINPHFLFNTLTSISSLIRTQPDTARMLIQKLSVLLRR